MAPYIGIMDGLTEEDRQVVVAYLISMKKEKRSSVDELRNKLNIPESEGTRWFRTHSAASEWDPQEAWNRLTDEQREAATRLRLTAEDMDERTFSIIEKHLSA